MVKLLWSTSLLTTAQHARAIKLVFGLLIQSLRKYDYGSSWYERCTLLIVLHLFMLGKDRNSTKHSGTFWVNLAADACGMFL